MKLTFPLLDPLVQWESISCTSSLIQITEKCNIIFNKCSIVSEFLSQLNIRAILSFIYSIFATHTGSRGINFIIVTLSLRVLAQICYTVIPVYWMHQLNFNTCDRMSTSRVQIPTTTSWVVRGNFVENCENSCIVGDESHQILSSILIFFSGSKRGHSHCHLCSFPNSTRFKTIIFFTNLYTVYRYVSNLIYVSFYHSHCSEYQSKILYIALANLPHPSVACRRDSNCWNWKKKKRFLLPLYLELRGTLALPSSMRTSIDLHI